MSRDAQVRAFLTLATRATFTAVAVTAALLARLAVFVAWCRRRIAVIGRHLLVCRCLARCVFALHKSQLRLATFAVCAARITVLARTTAIATTTTTTFARLTRFAGLTFSVALLGVAIDRYGSGFCTWFVTFTTFVSLAAAA